MSNNSNYEKLISSEEFKNAAGTFPVPFGELPDGTTLVQDMKSIPHMLVTGVIGCGKTTFVQSLMLTLCENHSPDEMKLLIYDSKLVDYQDFSKFPHLLLPIVSDGRKATGALQWLAIEINRRAKAYYENTCLESGEKVEFPEIFAVLDDYSNIIGEHECNDCITMILNKGRTVGVHLIMVTSASIRTVVTQQILSSTKMKISFYQPNEAMSKIAVGISGAERLNSGEIIVAEYGTLRTCTALSMDFDKIKQKTDAILLKYPATVETPSELSEATDKAVHLQFHDTALEIQDSNDEMLPKAVEVVLEMGSCSVSMLQRRLKLGYSRIARIVDQMEELGVVGPYAGAAPRTVTMTRDEWYKSQGIIDDTPKKCSYKDIKVSDKPAERGILCIKRRSHDSSPHRRINVYIDGEYEEELGQGDMVELELPLGEHSVLLTVVTLIGEYTSSFDISFSALDVKLSYEISSFLNKINVVKI